MRRFICVVGPTACGKSGVGVALSKRLNGEVISADSVQVYKGLDIGSAKITAKEACGIPHHLIDCVCIDDRSFSVAVFRELAIKAIDDIADRGKTPIVVGGTGLYINSLTYPLNFTEVPQDEAVRARLWKAEEDDPGSSYLRLLLVDRRAAEKIHPNNKKRVIRALEVYEISGKPFSEYGDDFQNEQNVPCDCEPTIIGLTMPRELLYERIEKRVDAMMEMGLADEVLGIMAKGYDASLPALSSLGYRQLISHFSGDGTSLSEAVEKIKLETRHFAKRQLTWFSRDKRIIWFDMSRYENRDMLVDEIAGHYADKA